MGYNNSALEDLADSVDLLQMLERLMAGLSADADDSRGVPWAGMQLTLNQIREKVLNAHRAAAQSGAEERAQMAVVAGAGAPAAKRVANSPLAGRIQMSPAGSASGGQSFGRTREIGASASGE